MTPALPTPTPTVIAEETSRGSNVGLIVGLLTIVIGGVLWWRFSRQ
jgi:hypothetical protein